MDWDETKRYKNLFKHGLDFTNADCVLGNKYRFDIKVIRNNEQRIQSFAYVFDYLAVLTVVHTNEGDRIISFRKASKKEKEKYYEWIRDDS